MLSSPLDASWKSATVIARPSTHRRSMTSRAAAETSGTRRTDSVSSPHSTPCRRSVRSTAAASSSPLPLPSPSASPALTISFRSISPLPSGSSTSASSWSKHSTDSVWSAWCTSIGTTNISFHVGLSVCALTDERTLLPCRPKTQYGSEKPVSSRTAICRP